MEWTMADNSELNSSQDCTDMHGSCEEFLDIEETIEGIVNTFVSL